MAPGAPEILVIDDSAIVRQSLTVRLRHFGFATREADDGARGVEEINRKAPALVLCDLRMPRMDGVEFMRVIRELCPVLPVIVISGAGLLEDAVAALKLGAWDYITKPIDEDAALKHAIDKALEKAALIAENKRYRETLEHTNRQLRESLAMLADDVNAGRQLQTRMLPRNHQTFGQHEFSRELLASSYLSGDVIDAFPVDERRWGFYLADVAGHGVPSALIAVLVRTFMQRLVESHTQMQDQTIMSPASVLTKLNQFLLRDLLDKHVTMFFGIIDMTEDTLLFANGGHFPWPILFDGRETVRIEKPSLPLGMFTHATYQEHCLKLPPQMVLAVYSDGLPDALPNDTIANKLNLLQLLFRDIDITTEKAIRALNLCDRRDLPDDVALLLIKGGQQP